jgi:hypothetical protein
MSLHYSFRSYIKVLNLLWVHTCVKWKTWIWFQFSAGRYLLSQHLLKRTSFLQCMFSDTLSKIRWGNCINLYLGFFYYTAHCICFCDSTMLFLLLWLWGIVWGQVLWTLQCCYFLLCIVLAIPSLVLPNELWGLFSNLCDECHQNFDGNCIEYVDCFW